MKTLSEIEARLSVLREEYEEIYDIITMCETESAYLFERDDPDRFKELFEIRKAMFSSGFMILQSIVNGSPDMRITVTEPLPPMHELFSGLPSEL